MGRIVRWSLAWGLGALSSPAWACGGLFCDSVQPVDQAGEKILFVIDDEAEQVEVHVQIAYQGPSEEFSWILPVPAAPELFLSVDDGLSRLAAATNPTFIPVVEQVGDCVQPPFVALSDKATNDSAEEGGVTVTSEAQVGPYDTQVLTATDATVLVQWLEDNGYDLPEGAIDRIRPYVAAGASFVGLKLSKDRDVGDLAPFGVRYAGTEPVIPLQLTGVAAAPDMRLQPFVLAKRRAVPENYLHVVVNELAVDWLNGAANYQDVITRAANEAGGLAFATDFAGPVDSLAIHLWEAGQYPLEGVAASRTVGELTSWLVQPFSFDTSWQREPRFPISAGTTPILARFVAVPDGIEAAAFFACPGCYGPRYEVLPVDGAGLSAALAAEWVAPMEALQGRLDASAYLTRLTSSISADEMTLDPRFVLNDVMGDVSAAHQATLQVLCNGLHTASGAPRRLVLADGRTLDLPPQDKMGADFTWDGWVGELADYPVVRIEQTARTGEPVVTVDYAADIDAILAARRGCGCDGGAVRPAWAGLLVALGAAWRRRRAR
jgi:hypothetical protein